MPMRSLDPLSRDMQARLDKAARDASDRLVTAEEICTELHRSDHVVLASDLPRRILTATNTVKDLVC